MTEITASQTGDGTGNSVGTPEVIKPTWIEQLPQELREDKTFHGFKTLGELAKAHKATLSERENLIKVPGEGASEEEQKAFWAKIGRPDTSDQYELDKPEIAAYTAEADKAFREVMLKANLSKNSAKIVHQAFIDSLRSGVEQQQKAIADEKAALEKSINTLKDEWKGDAFKVNTELAVRAFKKFGGEESTKFLEETKIGDLPLGSHPSFLKLFAAIGKTISDDSMHGDRTGTTNQLSDEDRAKARFPKTYKT